MTPTANAATGMPRSETDSETSSNVRERLVFIDFRCAFLGELRRADLMQLFGIGSAAATRDIAHYRGAMGGKIQLDPVSKVYQIGKGFAPLVSHDVQRALTALSRGFGESQPTTQGPLIACEVPPQLCNPRIDILAPISRAIHQRRAVRIAYSSFSSGQTLREIVPFALADNGLRWHVRAYDRRGHRFVDFVLTRIHTVDELPSSTIAPHELVQHDLDWSRVLELELVAHPKESHPEIVAMDYHMRQGVLKIRVRAALASYLLRQWLVDCTSDHSLKDTEYRLWLKNTPILYGIANAHLAPGYKP